MVAARLYIVCYVITDPDVTLLKNANAYKARLTTRINTPEALHCYAYHLIGAVGRTGRGLNRDITVNLFGHGEVGYIRQLKPEELISQGR